MDNSQVKKQPSIKIDVESYSKLRQKFHSIPEIGFKEFKTKELIIQSLKNIKNFDSNTKIVEVLETGLYVEVWGKSEISNKIKDNFLVAIRADIDGLPFEENSRVPYKSTLPQMAHGCGHDGHITILIATIEYFIQNVSKVPKNFGVRFFFQPAEEALGGAQFMLKENILKNVNEVYGLHNLTMFKVGEIGVVPGPIMAQTIKFEIDINGTAGHGSTPHKCKNPIGTGCQIISALNYLSSQEIDSKERHIISVGCFKSGEAANVIPEVGKIKGTIRTFNNEIGDKITNRIKEITDSCGNLNSTPTTVNFHEVGSTTTNHIDQAKLVSDIAEKYFSVSSQGLPVTGGEDFSYFMEVVPGCFFMLGTGDEDHKNYIHSSDYDYNDKATPYGVEMFIRIIEEKSFTQLI